MYYSESDVDDARLKGLSNSDSDKTKCPSYCLFVISIIKYDQYVSLTIKMMQ